MHSHLSSEPSAFPRYPAQALVARAPSERPDTQRGGLRTSADREPLTVTTRRFLVPVATFECLPPHERMFLEAVVEQSCRQQELDVQVDPVAEQVAWRAYAVSATGRRVDVEQFFGALETRGAQHLFRGTVGALAEELTRMAG